MSTWQAAAAAGITVAEVTYSNSISVSEHVVMMILALVRNYIPSYGWVVRGGWNIADCVERSYDLEGMAVGTVAAGRIGLAVLRRLKPFDVVLHYTDRHRLPDEVERDLGLTFHESAAAMVPHCDVVTINAPLYPGTEGLFDDELIGTMKRGSYLVNTARGKIANRDAVVRGPRERPVGRLRRRRLVPSARTAGPSLAHDAQPRDDPPHLGDLALGAGPLRRRDPGDPRVLPRRPAHPGGVPDRGRRPPGLAAAARSDPARVPTPPAEVTRAVPGPLSGIILHLLEKEPDSRYQTGDGPDL